MGNKAVPFLLGNINSKDPNIRANAINLLGRWLIATEAARPLLERFWVEEDALQRVIILESLERTIPDFTQMAKVFEQVVAKDKNEETLRFARETLDNLNQWKTDITAFAQKKETSAAAFQAAYTQLFKSVGKSGSYEALATFSTARDEPKLSALRERVLLRDSDEGLEDYRRITDIIIRNRLAASLENTRRSNELTGGDAR